jgi:hypothetical protein
MTTCDHCGADAVGADGYCRACGWRADGPAAGVDDTAAETREADVFAPVRPSLLSPAPGPARAATTGGRARYADQNTIGPGGRSRSDDLGQGPSSRYCGTCGARIEAGKQFCGQCGTPVFPAAGVDDGTALQRAVFPGVRGPADSWSAADQDAPTEEFGPYSVGGYAPSYGASGYYSQAGTTSAAQRSDTRILLGIFCVLGGLLSAAAAIILAVAPR